MIINGKEIAEGLYTELLAQKRGGLALGIVVASHDPVIESFVRIKMRAAERLGVEIRRIDLPHVPTDADALSAIEKLAPHVQGIIVQLPLPAIIDTEKILKAIPPYLDIDSINSAVLESEKLVHAPVAEAIAEILRLSQIEVRDKKCVVVGAGLLVGLPTASMLRELGGTVSMITREVGNMSDLLDADIIVLGAGNPGFVTPDMITDGVVLIDAGTSESGGKVVGDADPACADKCAIFTPVPGGVGPIAVAMIFKNLFTLVKVGALQPVTETKM